MTVRRAIRALGLVLGGLVAAVAALVLAAAGDYRVPATVTDDPALPRIEADGITLHARRFGTPEAPAVIVLHGGPGGDFRSLLALQALADRHHVVFYDQRGAGLSQRVPRAALTLEGHLAGLDAVIARVSPDAPVILIGHSWGAMLATAYLGRAPDRVSRAVLIEPGMLTAAQAAAFRDRAARYMSGTGFYARAAWTGLQSLHVNGPDPAAAEDFLWGRMMHAFADHPDNPYHCPGAPFDAPAWRAGALTGRTMAARAGPADYAAIADGAARYDGPVLLLAGGCDDWLGAPLQRRNLGLFRDARLRVIPGAGHDVVWDRPGPALAAIRAFLDDTIAP